MTHFTIGEIIREYRKQLKLSQEDLSSEDISVDTIQRIESGAEIPQKRIIRTLFERMNVGIPVNILPATKEELSNYLICLEIEQKIYDGNFNINDRLNEFKKNITNENIFDKQRYYLYKGLYTLYIQENIESAKKLFIISLSQTIKDFFKQGTIPVRNIYINTEIRIILELSICELKSKNYEKAEYLLQFLLKYIESNHTDNREQKIIMPKLFYYLSLLAENNKEIENMRDYSERGIVFNMKNDSMIFMQNLLKINASAYKKLGNKEKADELQNYANSYSKILSPLQNPPTL